MGKKVYLPDTLFKDMALYPFRMKLSEVESQVIQEPSFIGNCYIMAPLYALLRHNEKAFHNLITDDQEHNRVTVHLNYKGEPYDIEMDRTYITDSRADFRSCSKDVNLIIKALLISGLAMPGIVSDTLYDAGDDAKRFSRLIKFSQKTNDGGNPISIMSAFSRNMDTTPNLKYQKSLADKVENSLDDIEDALLDKFDEWTRSPDKVVILSLLTVTNHAVTLTGVDKKRKTITYYDQLVRKDIVVPLKNMLPDNFRTDLERGRLDQFTCFEVDPDNCQPKKCETVSISEVRQALRNKKKVKTEEAVISRLIEKFGYSFNEAWKSYTKENPEKMVSIVNKVLSDNGLSWEKWNNSYKLEGMLDAVKFSEAFAEEYQNRKDIMNGIKAILQSDPETKKDPEELGIIDPQRIKQLNDLWDRIHQAPELQLDRTQAAKAFTNLFRIFRNFNITAPDAESEDQQFPMDTRSTELFLQKAELAKKWMDGFLEAFENNNYLTAEDFNNTPLGHSIKEEASRIPIKTEPPKDVQNAAPDDIQPPVNEVPAAPGDIQPPVNEVPAAPDDIQPPVNEVPIPVAVEPAPIDDGGKMLNGDSLVSGYVKLLVASDATNSSARWSAVLAAVSRIANAQHNHEDVYALDFQRAYKFCRIYLDNHTGGSNRQDEIGGQWTERGRLRKAAVVNYLKILEELGKKQPDINVHKAYEKWCHETEQAEFIPLDFDKLESSLVSNMDKKIKSELDGYPNKTKAYAELNKKTKLKLKEIKAKKQEDTAKKTRTKNITSAEKEPHAIKKL